jgi:cyanate lyase
VTTDEVIGTTVPAMKTTVRYVQQEHAMISSRSEVTQMIVSAKVARGLKWSGIAERIGASKEWTTAACLGQMTFTKQQAEIAGEISGLSDEAVAWLQIVPYKGALPTAVPTDPLIYRWYEIVNVYGTTIKELIHEEFGDGIMSAIDFHMDIVREPDPKGDRGRHKRRAAPGRHNRR